MFENFIYLNKDSFENDMKNEINIEKRLNVILNINYKTLYSLLIKLNKDDKILFIKKYIETQDFILNNIRYFIIYVNKMNNVNIENNKMYIDILNFNKNEIEDIIFENIIKKNTKISKPNKIKKILLHNFYLEKIFVYHIIKKEYLNFRLKKKNLITVLSINKNKEFYTDVLLYILKNKNINKKIYSGFINEDKEKLNKKTFLHLFYNGKKYLKIDLKKINIMEILIISIFNNKTCIELLKKNNIYDILYDFLLSLKKIIDLIDLNKKPDNIMNFFYTRDKNVYDKSYLIKIRKNAYEYYIKNNNGYRINYFYILRYFDFFSETNFF